MRATLSTHIATAPTGSSTSTPWKPQLASEDPEVDNQKRQDEADAFVARSTPARWTTLKVGVPRTSRSGNAHDARVDRGRARRRPPRTCSEPMGAKALQRNIRRATRQYAQKRRQPRHALHAGQQRQLDATRHQRESPAGQSDQPKQEPGGDPEGRIPIRQGRIEHDDGGLDEERERRQMDSKPRCARQGGSGAARQGPPHGETRALQADQRD